MSKKKKLGYTPAQYVEAINVLRDSEIRGSFTVQRATRLAKILSILGPEDRANLRLVECTHWGGDPYRYGKAMKRVGFCAYLGGGGRNKGEKPYQIWAEWTSRESEES